MVDDRLVTTTELTDSVARLTLDRPEKLNAMNKALLRAVPEAIRDCSEYDVLIVDANGDSFTAGADLDEAQEESEEAGLYQEMTRATREFEGLVIGQLHGYVIGGGFEWTLSFDLRYAADDTVFKMTESEVGLPISNASTMYLPLLIGGARARELVYTCRDLPAAEAEEIGLVNGVFPRERLTEEVRAVADDVVENKSSLALRLNKKGFNNAFPVEDVLEFETVLGDLANADPSEGIDW
ncbi:enoyl-CoA hydratase/isomerase family protein [Natronomonas sp.]|uniref:enoyl-CoA hydratase/isomerase family protein n=1 Tax=Natronomonas sp. TaxID=2184060 RepID=UPI00262224E4|nr:enoyl-CoA hydratase/isomerase family protein [Natronomonas sp.]